MSSRLCSPRNYALRRIKDGFQENKNVDNPKSMDQLLSGARESLALIKRQVGFLDNLLIVNIYQYNYNLERNQGINECFRDKLTLKDV